MRSWAKSCLVSCLFILCLANSQTASDAIRISSGEIGFGARALAMGGAYTALSNDFSAIYWNPAGLAGIPRGGIFAEGLGTSLLNKITYLGSTASVDDYNRSLGAIGLVSALPTVRGSFVIGVGINKISSYDDIINFSGFSNVDNELEFKFIENDELVYHMFNKNVQRSEKIRSVGGVNQISIGMGVALSPRTTAGLSYSSVSTQEEYRFIFTQSDSENLYENFPADFNDYFVTQDLTLEGRASKFRLGLLTAITPKIKTGINIALPSNFTITEQHYLEEELSFDDGSTTDSTMSGFWDYGIKTPLSVDGGLAITGSSLTISVSTRFKDWKNTRFNLNNIDRGTEIYDDLLAENRVFSQEYKSTVEFHAGGEYVIRIKGNAFSLRIGYANFPSPLLNSTNRKKEYATGGISFSPTKQFIINLTYLGTSFKRISSDEYTPSGTIENFTKSTIVINAMHRF